MVKLSRLESEYLGWFINSLWNAFTLAKDKIEIRALLKDLLTHTEIKMLAKRLQIAKMLLEGYDYQSIKQAVKVTDPTIAKISNGLEEKGEGLRQSVTHLWQLEANIKKKYEPPSLRDKYPQYFALDRLLTQLQENMRQRRKNRSAFLETQEVTKT